MNSKIPETSYRDFDDITDCKHLSLYMSERVYNHSRYYHYTSLSVIESILNRNEIWLSCITGFNDENDSMQFEESQRALYYSTCFTSGLNENLALWYMYSGVDGCGARLNISNAILKRLVSKSRFKLCRLDGNEIIEDIMDLEIDKDFRLTIKDILYYRIDKKNNQVSLKYNNLRNYIISAKELKKYIKENKGFCKDIVWYYEKELRILSELMGNAKEFVLNNPNGKYVVVLSFDGIVRKNIKIDFAPEIEHKNLKQLYKDHPAIELFYKETQNCYLSEYSGRIHMRFCQNCSKNESKQ